MLLVRPLASILVLGLGLGFTVTSFAAPGRTVNYTSQAPTLNSISANFLVKNFPGEVHIIAESPQRIGGFNVLFVIDDSGSMDYYQKALRENAPLFSDLFKRFGVGKVGIVTTGYYEEHSPTSPVILDSNSSTFAPDLSKAVVPGTAGSGAEAPFDSMMKFMETNSNFFQTKAVLTVFITDAEDQSKISAKELYDSLVILTGSPSMYSATSAIIPTSETNPSCSRDDLARTPLRIEEFHRLAGGSVVNLCQMDFGTQLTQKITEKLQSGFGVGTGWTYTSIPLPSKPNLSSVIVKWGSTILRPGDALLGWTYDSNANSLILGTAIDWSYWHPNTQKIEVIYKPSDWE